MEKRITQVMMSKKLFRARKLLRKIRMVRLTMDQQPPCTEAKGKKLRKNGKVRKNPQAKKKHQYLKETKEMEKEKTNPIKKSKKDASSDKEPATLPGAKIKEETF